jgi:hypothetical protein
MIRALQMEVTAKRETELPVMAKINILGHKIRHDTVTLMAPKHTPTIKDLYPGLTDDQLKEAEENFDAYLQIVWRIFQRIRSDPEAYSRFKTLTATTEKPYDET